MKKKTVILLAILVAVFAGAMLCYRVFSEKMQPEIPPELPDAEAQTKVLRAPELKLLAKDGTEVLLSKQFGKPMAVTFWATWCTSCNQMIPVLESAYAQYEDRVTFLMVDLTDGKRDTAESVFAFAEENALRIPVLCDADYAAMKLYGITGIPTTVFLDADGDELARYVGPIDEATLQYYLDSLTQ